jgi:hypothetical protein
LNSETNPNNLVSDPVTLDTLRNLFFSEDKPDTLQSIDVAVVAYLILRKCEDHEVYDSYRTIAERVNCERQAVSDSIARLKNCDWITVAKRRPGQTACLSINAESMPAERAVREKITTEAKSLAANYTKALLTKSPAILIDRRVPRRKHFIKNQFPSAQRILTKCNGDRDLAGKVVGFAIIHSKHRKKAQIGLYHLLMKWDAILAEYHATPKKGTA